ncbi:MAG TPA: thiamine pyrophosphate-dependent enzyme [Bacillota bacterium]|jgi:thiamine pyrophosphate-dependent acetolactate synthase large subunit-like protein
MKTHECFELLAPHAPGAVVVCALGMAANEWWAVTQSEETFYMHGAMGFASSFALGIALSMPRTPVWVLNGDGSMCMNLGSLLTEAAYQPDNLKHFVVANRVYQTVGGLPMAGQQRTDYAAMARGAGVREAVTVGSLGEMRAAIPRVLAPGYLFTVLDVESEAIPIIPPPQPYEGAEMKYRFGRAMERRFGVKVFGSQGY